MNIIDRLILETAATMYILIFIATGIWAVWYVS